MTIVGFIQSYNNVGNGFLRRCLKSLSLVADHIVVYDDASTENVRSLYQEFDCTVIYGIHHEFKRELYHKQALLSIAYRYRPDWICWIDTDTVLGRYFEKRERVEGALAQAEIDELPRIHLHNLNLWLSPWWYRIDGQYNDLWHGVWWRNTGELHYQPIAKLHQKQYPHSFRDSQKDAYAMRLEPHFDEDTAKLIHFGFASAEEIARKYFTYRENGQTGWPLTRLVDETARQLVAVPAEWYPEWLLSELDDLQEEPTVEFKVQEMEKYDGFAQWQRATCGT